MERDNAISCSGHQESTGNVTRDTTSLTFALSSPDVCRKRDCCCSSAHGAPWSPLDIPDRRIDVGHFYARQANVAVKANYNNLRNGINVALRFMVHAPLSSGCRLKILQVSQAKTEEQASNW